ncbi:unnamed protein product [Brassica rapa]|uniref:Uncharacterized protein n=1 Tax=Brassica campestris TaxID=3711 RepID=A0A3P5Z5Z2_BRACM|nr:unnamed protein product [Brassica rapa]VDC75302.1 unnamed protein product [Brassica rapa]
MTKSRNKKKRGDDAVSMDVSETKSVSESAPQAMDTSETGDAKLAARTRNLTSAKKGKPMKRTKNARKVKAVAKAIAKNDKYEEKASKHVSKKQRTLSAKKLYE